MKPTPLRESLIELFALAAIAIALFIIAAILYCGITYLIGATT